MLTADKAFWFRFTACPSEDLEMALPALVALGSGPGIEAGAGVTSGT